MPWLARWDVIWQGWGDFGTITGLGGFRAVLAGDGGAAAGNAGAGRAAEVVVLFTDPLDTMR